MSELKRLRPKGNTSRAGYQHNIFEALDDAVHSAAEVIFFALLGHVESDEHGRGTGQTATYLLKAISGGDDLWFRSDTGGIKHFSNAFACFRRIFVDRDCRGDTDPPIMTSLLNPAKASAGVRIRVAVITHNASKVMTSTGNLSKANSTTVNSSSAKMMAISVVIHALSCPVLTRGRRLEAVGLLQLPLGREVAVELATRPLPTVA